MVRPLEEENAESRRVTLAEFYMKQAFEDKSGRVDVLNGGKLRITTGNGNLFDAQIMRVDGVLNVTTINPNQMRHASPYSDEISYVLKNKIETLLFAYYDPDSMLVPVLPRKGLFAEVELLTEATADSHEIGTKIPREPRHSTDLREVWLKLPPEPGRQSAQRLCGLVEYPFSMRDLYGIVMSEFEDEFAKDDGIFTLKECTSSFHPEVHALSIYDKWSIAYTTRCLSCAETANSLKEAVPSHL
ncbi:gp063 [Rhodococcus phage ReqiDocB7]|uniref:gp063 n=1 Tax=Rhodococcus phage ReqiDocB7 TaxID=691966 RepID=UPI0001CDD858|nr:gp063 [Rhodococcus phage ReqiDocB7]ADD80849.1 gp063 [Rhodococcus phage ReqiDocB7]